MTLYTIVLPLLTSICHRIIVTCCCDSLQFFLPWVAPGWYVKVWDNWMTKKCNYSWMKVVKMGMHGSGVDSAWAMYDGDWTRTPREAQIAKFENIFKQLGLEEGMHVLDIGCGFGDWLAYLRDVKGCTGLGIELTPAHVHGARLLGLEVLEGPWQYYAASADFEKKYAGKFDAVTCCDNAEHWMEPEHVMDGAMFEKVYRRAFVFAHRCTNPKSKCKSMYISALHQNRPNDRSFYEMFNIYLLIARYGGMYPGKLPWSSLKARAAPEYIIDYEMDKIEEYRHHGFTMCGFQMQPGNLLSLTHILSIPVFLMAYPHFELAVWDHYRHENSWTWHVGGLAKKIYPNVICSLMVSVYRRQDVPVTYTKDWVKVGNVGQKKIA